MKEKKNKSVYRFFPVSHFDIEGLQNWLSDMALDGYILEKDGMKGSYAVFQKCEPKDMRYRFVVVGNGVRSVASEERPVWEERIYYKELGWDYIATQNGLHIYCTSNPDVREMHTEPEVQAMTFERLRRRYIGLLIYRIILILLPILVFSINMVSTMLRMRSWVVILWLVGIVWIVFDAISESLVLRRIQKKLQAGIELERSHNWRKNGRKYAVKEIVTVIAATVLLAGVVLYHVSYKPDRNRLSLSEFEGETPFATVADFAPNDEYFRDNFSSNEFKRWNDLIAPVCIIWDEGATFYFEDGGEYGCHIMVQYYEMRADWLARALVREYKISDLRRYEFIDVEVPGADYAFIYYDYVLNIVIRDGNRVVHARVSNLGTFAVEHYDIDLTDEEYIGIVAEEFLK